MEEGSFIKQVLGLKDNEKQCKFRINIINELRAKSMEIKTYFFKYKPSEINNFTNSDKRTTVIVL